jgi:hypothetical protein
VAGGTEKFDAAGFGHELAGTGELAGAANDIEMDAGGGPLENTGELDDGGGLDAAGSGLDGADSDPVVESGPTALPHATSAAVAAAALNTRADTRRVRAAGSPTVASRRPALCCDQGRNGAWCGCL